MLTTLLYGSEAWTVYQCHAGKLNHFRTTHLRKLLGIKWQDKIPDTEVLAHAGLPSIHTLLKKSQFRWAGHVARMPDNQLPKKMLFGLGGPKKRYKDTLKGSRKSFNLNSDTWELAAQNRNEWRAAPHNGAITHEKERTITAEKRRQARKSNADRCSSPAPNVQELAMRRLVCPATYAPTNRMIRWSRTNNLPSSRWLNIATSTLRM